MIPQIRYRLGTAIVLVAVLILAFDVLEMTEVIPRYVPPLVLAMSALICVSVARSLRRGAMAQMSSSPPQARPELPAD